MRRRTSVNPNAATSGHRDLALVDEGVSADVARLYEAHARQATGFAYLLTGDRELAQDIVQEAFVRLIGRFGHIRNRDAFAFYLTKTVANLAKNQSRRREVTVGDSSLRIDERQVPVDVEQGDALWHALLSLPERQRSAIVLRFYEDLSEAQAADVMGVSVRAVNSLVTRGLRSLREKHPWEDGEDEE